jgi:acetoin utilization deacetylase AcuC-like enzyme
MAQPRDKGDDARFLSGICIMTTIVYTHAACMDHRPGPGHPEAPARLTAVLDALQTPEFSALTWRDAPRGTREQVALVHRPDFIDLIIDNAPSQGHVVLDGGDTVMSPGSLEAVMRCVGAACAGVDDVMSGAADNVFCATRPCGHHAEPSRAMGFCVFNQAAIAAVHAQQAHGLSRVAVVDFDVHHGNGTQAAFYDKPGLFYASSHQSPFYPGTGSRAEHGVANNIVNLPLARGADSEDFRTGTEAEILPALRAFKPELLIISAGFDAHHLDPLAGLNLTDDDFAWITEELMKIAASCCKGRVVSILEGGYSLEGLASGTAAHLRAMMGAQ